MAKRKARATPSSSEPPTASCLLICQDVIRGITQQRHVLHGVIDLIIVKQLPARVGPFAAYVRLSNVYGGQKISLTFGLAGDDDELFRLDAKSPKASDPLETHTLIVEIPPFEITDSGRYIFQAIHADVPFAQSPIQVRLIDPEEPQ